MSLTVTVMENIKEGLSYQSLYWASVSRKSNLWFLVSETVVEEQVY